jgi:hypothetical protein
MSQSTLENVMEQVWRLAPAEQHKLRDALDARLRNATPYRAHDLERAWIEQHRDEYMNQWVALDGDLLLAHGTDPRAVYLAARSAGCEAPFMEQVAPKLGAFMGGWL